MHNWQAVKQVLSKSLMKKMETSLDWPQPTGICKDVLFQVTPLLQHRLDISFNDLQMGSAQCWDWETSICACEMESDLYLEHYSGIKKD